MGNRTIFGHEVFSAEGSTKTRACLYLFDKPIKSLCFCLFVVSVVCPFSFQDHTKTILSLSNACYADYTRAAR